MARDVSITQDGIACCYLAQVSESTEASRSRRPVPWIHFYAEIILKNTSSFGNRGVFGVNCVLGVQKIGVVSVEGVSFQFDCVK